MTRIIDADLRASCHAVREGASGIEKHRLQLSLVDESRNPYKTEDAAVALVCPVGDEPVDLTRVRALMRGRIREGGRLRCDGCDRNRRGVDEVTQGRNI